MTDPSGIKPITGNPAAQGHGKGQVVQIVSLPEGLQNNARAIRLQGEVVRQNDDGSVRVRTPQGDIDIQLRGRQPQPGQPIEIDVPPGSPPRQATVRPAPAQPAQPQPQQPAPQAPPDSSTPPPQTPPPPSTTRPVPPPATTPPAQGEPAPPPTGGSAQPLPPQTPQPLPGQPPVSVPVQQEAPLPARPDTYLPTAETANRPGQTVPPPPLAPGQIVKLAPVMPAAVPMQDIPENTIAPKTPIQTATVAPKGEGSLMSNLLQAVKSALPQSVSAAMVPTIPSAVQSPPPPAGTQTPKALPSNVTQMPLVLSAKIVSLVLPSGQSIAMPPISAAPLATPAASPVATAAVATPLPSVIAPLIVTVTDLTPQQQPVISVPMNDKGAVQNFIIQSPPASVPVGTQVTLQPQPVQVSVPATQALQPSIAQMPVGTPTPPPAIQIAPPASMLPPAWRGLLPPLAPATVWPVMDELFQSFYQATPQAAQILGRTIPSPANGASFGPAVILFAAALKSGELQAWMGEKKMEMIQKLGKESLLARLSAESSTLTANSDAPATEWKSFPVPLLWQNEISKVMFHVRKEPSEQEQKDGDGATRFVMDLSLTRMGEVQIDGLVREKQLDLTVRTQMPVSSSMQDAMRTAYAKALDGTDIYGDIGFQGGGANWETVLMTGNAGQSV